MSSSSEAAAEVLELDKLIRRIAREMRVAAAIADDLQDVLGAGACGALDADAAMRLQRLDLLTQHLIELGGVLDRLATEGVGGDTRSALLEEVRLSDLKRRLAGLDAAPAVTSDADFW